MAADADDDDVEALAQAGRDVQDALIYWQQWSHRKVEAVSLLEGDRSRRRVSMDLSVVVDLRWPIALPPLDAPDERQIAVPLATIAKVRMRSFDVTDDAGRSLPILATDDNGVLAAAFLVHLIETEKNRVLTTQQRRLVDRVVFRHGEMAARAADRLIADLGLRDTLSQQFLLRLSEEFILFALVGPERLDTRMVVKYSYHWEMHPDQSRAEHGDGFKGYLRQWWDRAKGAAGFTPREFELELGAPDTAETVHFEIPAPQGLQLVDLRLFDGPNVVAEDVAKGTVGHVYSKFDQTAGQVRAVARFDPAIGGLHRLVMLSAFGVAALLSMTMLRFAHVSADPGTPTSLLLFGPAILLTLLVRPGENAIVTAVVGPLRVTAVGLAGLLFWAGLVLSLGLGPPPPKSVLSAVGIALWWAAVGVSAACGIVLAVGSLRLRSRLRSGEGNQP